MELWSTGAPLFAVPNTTDCLIGGFESSTGAPQRAQSPGDSYSIRINRREAASTNGKRENCAAG